MKRLLNENWTAWRVVRFVLSLVFAVFGLVNKDYFLTAGGLFLMFQSLFNAGCCTDDSCEVKYKEVRIKNK